MIDPEKEEDIKALEDAPLWAILSVGLPEPGVDGGSEPKEGLPETGKSKLPDPITTGANKKARLDRTATDAEHEQPALIEVASTHNGNDKKTAEDIVGAILDHKATALDAAQDLASIETPDKLSACVLGLMIDKAQTYDAGKRVLGAILDQPVRQLDKVRIATLGADPATGKMRPDEERTAGAVEAKLQVRLSRYRPVSGSRFDTLSEKARRGLEKESTKDKDGEERKRINADNNIKTAALWICESCNKDKGDWIDEQGRTYDGCSPPPANRGFANQVKRGGNKELLSTSFQRSLLEHLANPSVTKVVVDITGLGLQQGQVGLLDQEISLVIAEVKAGLELLYKLAGQDGNGDAFQDILVRLRDAVDSKIVRIGFGGDG